MRGNHFVRQWRLLRLVNRPGALTVADGAREVGCSIRTVWRDLRAFQDTGIRRWVLCFVGDAEVLEPASLRDAIRHEAERLTALLASSAVPVRDGIGMDRKPLARRTALAPSRRASAIKRNRAGASRRA